MFRRAALWVLALASVAFVSHAAAQEAMDRSVSQKLRAATVMVFSEYEDAHSYQLTWGTGFIIGDGVVMTNAHVVGGNSPTRVFVTNELLPATEARVVAHRYDTSGVVGATGPYGHAPSNDFVLNPARSNFDVAVLSFQPPAGVRLPELKFARDRNPAGSVFAVGYPAPDRRIGTHHSGPESARTMPPVMTAGQVHQLIGGQPSLVMHDAFCKTGNSGGPVVNARGEIVGMQTWSTHPDDPSMYVSFAISGHDLVRFLYTAGIVKER